MPFYNVRSIQKKKIKKELFPESDVEELDWFGQCPDFWGEF